MTEPFSVEKVAEIGPISGEWHPAEATGFAIGVGGIVMHVVVSSNCAIILDGTTKSIRDTTNCSGSTKALSSRPGLWNDTLQNFCKHTNRDFYRKSYMLS